MSKRSLAMLVGVAALAILVAGCGGSDDEAMTKAEYVKQGNEICSQEGKQLAADLDAYSKKHDLKGTDEEAVGEAVETIVLPAFRNELEELQELPIPEGDEKQVEAILTKFEAGLEEGEKDPANFFSSEREEFAAATELAQDYGLQGCGNLFV